ncbi:MAG: hypothetical protein RL722_433 [Pseudomonadota bacterium]|jgi:hypothetical protein
MSGSSDVGGGALQAFLAAGADLLKDALAAARLEDAAGVDGLALAVRGGALVQLRLTLGATGVAWVAVDVVEPGGATSQLMAAELKRGIVQ